ncbi:MAG TPA: MFS transporter [Symbiobacteriaceae bacterium]|jgi:MFS family permease
MLSYLRNLYHRHSPTVWLLALGRLVDMTTLWMAMPFMAIFINRAGASASVTGLVLALNPVAQLIGNIVGGQWSDRRGRRPVILFAMGFRVFVLLFYAFAGHVWQFAVLSFCNGLVNALFNPAYTAAIADSTDPKERLEAFSLSRVMSNLGVGLGPLLGGAFGIGAQRFLFSTASLSSLAVGTAFFLYLKEPKRGTAPPPAGKSRLRETLENWGTILTDRALFIFIAAGVLSQIAYVQVSSSLSIHLSHTFADFEHVYAFIWTLNGALVVLLQLPVSAVFRRQRMVVPAVLGPAVFAVGYALFALAGTPFQLHAAATVWTIGEVILAVPQTTFATDIAPVDLRARYAGAAALDRALGGTIAPILGTAVLQAFGGRTVMFGAAGAAICAGVLYYFAEQGRSRRLALADRVA